MGKEKARTTKWTLKELPKVNSPFRISIISELTEHDDYKKELGNGIPGFTSEELKEIEEKYQNQGGMQNKDIQNELKKKGLPVKQNTIKHYIKVNQLPKPIKHEKTGIGPKVAIYPLDFMRHLNFVRFMLTIGRERCGNLLKKFYTPPSTAKISDYSFLQTVYYGKEICDSGEEICDSNSVEGFAPFLYDAYSEMFSDMSLIANVTDIGLNHHIGILKTIIASINGDENLKIDNEFKQYATRFNKMKLKLEYYKTVDSEFYNKIKFRLNKYLSQLKKVKQILEDVSKRFDSLIQEAKNASWT